MSELFHSKQFYSSIVQEVHYLINEDVILTNPKGFIVASTDSNRVNDFHEGALLSMQKKKYMVMTEDLTTQLKGVRKGVVLPIILDDKPLGVIGITGEPEKVKPFAMLVQKVAELFVKDSIIQANDERQARELEFFVFDWLNSKEITKSLVERSRFYNINFENYERVVVLKSTNSTLQLSYKDLNRLKVAWDQKGNTLFIRWGQDKILMLLNNYNDNNYLRQKLIKFLKEIERIIKAKLCIGVGKTTTFDRIYISFDQANRACEASLNKGDIVFEDELRFDILQQKLDKETKQKFVKRTIHALLDEEALLYTLDCWFRNNMSNKITAEQLHIHKNTLLYRLKRIEELTDMSLNKTHDLVILYISHHFLNE